MRSARIPQLWRVGGRRVVRIPDDTRIIPPSEFMARRLKADGLTIHSVIRNFVPEVDEKRRNRNRDCTRLAYVGIMEPHKGPSTLLEAFASSRKRHRFHLSLIGDGSLRNRLVDRVARLGLEERVWVPGHLSKSDLDSALDATSLLVVPSEWYENSPLTVLEAFACGIPVLGSNLGGLPEILDRESGAMVFSAGDVDNLASRLVEIWDTRDQLSEMGMKARSAYERRFTPQAYIAQYMKAIDTM